MTKSALALVFILATCSACIADQNERRLHPRDLYVIDGDTVRFDGTSIRLLGFDTPETFRPQCEAERVLGFEAKARLRSLLDQAPVVTLSLGKGTDRYGRLLGNLRVDGNDVGDIIVAERLARPYSGGQRGSWCN